MRIETITPSRATQLRSEAVEAGVPMRNIFKSRVRTYARDMKEGRWWIASALMLDDTGTLVDGHHRCEACIISQVPFKSIVLDYTGCPKELVDCALRAIDTGASRTAGNKLEMEGIVPLGYGGKVSAAVNLLWRHDNYSLAERSEHPSYLVLREITLDVMPDMLDSVRAAASAKHLMMNRNLSVLHYLFSQRDRELADLFVDALATGERLTTSDPVYLLRERLIKNQGAKRKMSPHEIMAITIKAWNWTRNGNKVSGRKYLNWRSKGKTAEPFPQVA